MPVAMVPRQLAKLGQLFKFIGEKPECRTCEFRNICVQNLRPGKFYKIIEVRDAVHECPAYGIEMKVVEVVEVDTPLVVEQKAAAGETVKATRISCTNTKCPYYGFCMNPEAEDGEKYEVVSVEKEIECPLNRKLFLVFARKKRFPF
ncbi:MAG: hypothetical protein GXO42_01015 [bacterium]|nr:hypothetical protein [bacterium]